MALFVPMMKADFAALAEYEHAPSERFDIPITVMIGKDEEISREDVLAWQDLTRRVITVKEFSGGHFFIFDHAEEIGRLISQTLI
jgi:surfactin synthase thioesterase subunit